MSRPTPPTYRTKNWPAYNEALKRRGLLTIWFDPEMSWDGAPTCRRGRQQSYSDAAIQTCLSMKVLFGMALRQTAGFVESLLRLAGLDWTVPDFSTLSRRQKTLAVNIPYRGSKGPLHLLIDSTGIEGEGEWHARKHGGPKRRVWRKIHLGIDEETLEIRAVEITGSHIGDAPVLPDLLGQIPADQEIGSVTADGAYDTRKCHDAIANRSAHAVIPPRKNAKPWKTVTAGAVARNEALRASKYLGRALWRPSRDMALPCPAGQWMERIPPPKPRRNEDALCQTAGPAAHGAGLRPTGRRAPGPHRRPERLHRARHTRHGSCEISPSGERGTSAFSRFVQQSR
ncbi:Transposase DDE domain protein [Falsiruegeria litorea R37]|uniref:Transposase DDE domain protein n=1 Tax=Falsiruegeria litorea R37 TaxID=1200284 RepID=A0A1Y5T655_9RHOB|nr:Transposase DDE domain protein [Falsiruegeria litorea R37]